MSRTISLLLLALALGGVGGCRKRPATTAPRPQAAEPAPAAVDSPRPAPARRTQALNFPAPQQIELPQPAGTAQKPRPAQSAANQAAYIDPSTGRRLPLWRQRAKNY